jgi:hypothetical protein
MNIKLLKKIRKRYDWYFNKEKYPVLICHNTKEVISIDFEYCTYISNYTLEDVKQKVKIDYTEWALRLMKVRILKNYGITYNNLLYHRINRSLNNKKKKYNQYGKK